MRRHGSEDPHRCHLMISLLPLTNHMTDPWDQSQAEYREIMWRPFSVAGLILSDINRKIQKEYLLLLMVMCEGVRQ